MYSRRAVLVAPTLLATGCRAQPYGQAARVAPEDVSVTLSGSPVENSRQLQDVIDAGYGKRINLFGEADFLGVTITPRPAAPGLQLIGRGAQGYRGSVLRNVGKGDALTIRNTSRQPYNGPLAIKDLGLHGTAGSGCGILAEEINGQFLLEGLWLDGHGGHNVSLRRCYGMEIRRCLSNNAGGDGFAIMEAGNNIVLDHVRSFAAKGANIRIGGTSPALAPVLIAPDVSYGRLGLSIEHALGVSILGFYSEDTPIAARFAPGVEFTAHGGLVQAGVIEALGTGSLSAMHFRGRGGLRAGPNVVANQCVYADGATLARVGRAR